MGIAAGYVNDIGACCKSGCINEIGILLGMDDPAGYIGYFYRKGFWPLILKYNFPGVYCGVWVNMHGSGFGNSNLRNG